MAGGTLRVGMLAPIRAFEPRETGDLVTALAVSQVFETPFRLAGAGEPPEPVLFESLVSEEGGRVWSGPVRSGIVFSDGTPLDASRLAASLRRAESVRRVADLEVRGSTVVFRLRRPNPRFDLHLTFEDCGVVLETQRGEKLGTGPWRLAEGPDDSGLALERAPHAVGSGPDRVEFRVYPPDDDGRPTALLQALERGEVDYTDQLSKGDVANVTGYKKLLRPAMSLAILFLNTTRAPLASAARRRAIAHALDRRKLTGISHDNVVAFSATSVLPPSFGMADDGLRFDAARARALLQEAGSISEPLRMLTVWAPRPYLPHPRPTAEAIVAQLDDVGIRVVPVFPSDGQEFFERQRGGDYDLLLGGWICDLPDPVELLTALFDSERIPRPDDHGIASGNIARWDDPRCRALLETYRETGDDADRDAVLSLVAAEAPVVPLMVGATVVVHSWGVRGVRLPASGSVRFADVELDAP